MSTTISEERGSVIQSQSRSTQSVSQTYRDGDESIAPDSQSSFSGNEDRKQPNTDRIIFNGGRQTCLAEFKLVKPDLDSVLKYVEHRFNIKFCYGNTERQESNTALQNEENNLKSTADQFSSKEKLQKNMANPLRAKQRRQPYRYLTKEEKMQLNNFWKKCKYPSPKDYEDLANLTNIPKSKVKSFFQRQRYEERIMRKALLLD